MTHIMFAQWFGIVSVLLSLGILFNLEDAQDMARSMIKTETGYIMGGVLPIIFGTLSLMFVDTYGMTWDFIITIVGLAMISAGIFRVMLPRTWKALMSRHIETIPFLFSLFGLMFGVMLLYIGYISSSFQSFG